METWHHKYINSFYSSQPGWIDGTTEFHQLCKKYIRRGELLLDFGSGNSNPSSKYFYSLGGTIIGIDIDNTIKINSWNNLQILYDGNDFPLRSSIFNCVVSDYVLEHLQNPKFSFKEISRVLRPGGFFIFRTPNTFHYLGFMGILIPHFIKERVANWLRRSLEDAPLPFRAYYKCNSRRRCQDALNRYGFEVIELHLVEKEPSYGVRFRGLFLLLVAYERLVNKFDWLENFRANIFCVAKKL